MVAFAVLNLLDALTTYLGGIQNESNQVVVSIGGGMLGLLAIKVLLIVYFAATIAILRKWSSTLALVTLRIGIAIYVVTVAWNIRYLVLR